MKLIIALILFIGGGAALAAPSAKLSVDDKYDFEKGCYDIRTGQNYRIQLNTVEEIQARLDSKDFECTEMSDVIIEDGDGTPMYSSNGPSGLKIVFLRGSSGPLGSAGATGFNFNGAKFTNLFLDYMMRMAGTVNGLNTKGIFLAFYAEFSPLNCSTAGVNNNLTSLPPYASTDGNTVLITLDNKFLGPDSRLFGEVVSICK